MGKNKNKAKKKKEIKELPKDFDKYSYYIRSVQNPEGDVEFLRDTYKELVGGHPTTMAEDFCGTYSICCEWVKMDPNVKAIGVDLDPEPLEYGTEHYFSKLTEEQKERVSILNANVLNPDLPKADVINALNFSYFIFKQRKSLKEYFQNVHHRLNDGGIFVMDIFGGSQCQESIEEETEHEDFSYFWDQSNFDPVNNHAVFHIHFKPKGKKKIEKVFTYDWRMWTIPELRDILEEVGFRRVHVYWEGTTEDGDGDGNFVRVEKGEECEAWIAYIVAEK